jgi:hypothetical protein
MTGSARYRAAVAAVDARQWTGTNFDELVTFLHTLPSSAGCLYVVESYTTPGQLCLWSDSTVEDLELGDWIVYLRGEFLACTRRLFDAGFELIAVTAESVEDND